MAAVPLPEITSQSEEGFHDMVFAVLQGRKEHDGARTIDMAGTFHGKTVAFRVVLAPGWHEERKSFVTHWGHLKFVASGPSSDALVAVIDSLYGTQLGFSKFKREVTFRAVSLEGDPDNLENEPVKLKLFYDSSNEENYAEIYLNLDLQNETAELRRKIPTIGGILFVLSARKNEKKSRRRKNTPARHTLNFIAGPSRPKAYKYV